MRIVYMGTPDFAVGALKALIEAGHEIVLVVTQPDRPKGRKMELSVSPVKACAEAYGLPVFQPEKIKKPEAVEFLKTVDADIYVVAAFGQILSREILDIPMYGCINIHASLLPKYRGASPIQSAILNGDKVTGVTIQQMDAGCDTGNILMQRTVPIDDDDTAGTMFDKLSMLGASMITAMVELIEKGQVRPVQQDNDKSTNTVKMNKEMGRIKWSRPAQEIERTIRAMNPWPSAYTTINGKNLKIWKAAVIGNKPELLMKQENAVNMQKAEPATICAADNEGILIKTGDGILALLEIQLEGKKRMPVKEFLMGNHIDIGTVLE